MPSLPSRFRRLDGILADLPVDEPMLLSELDGYLTGIAVSPEPMAPAEWLPPIWGGDSGDTVPFEDPTDVQVFADMVIARHVEIRRDLARGKPQPLFEIDERNGEVLWDVWIDGFDLATTLRPDGWTTLTQSDDANAVAALAAMRELAGIAFDETALTSVEVNALCDTAPDLIPDHLMRLYGWQGRRDCPTDVVPQAEAKIGRNDPCPCGSGKKHKRCCGTN